MDLEGYGVASQRMQADALGGAFAGWRRLWRGRGREECGGALVWQVSYPFPCGVPGDISFDSLLVGGCQMSWWDWELMGS